MVIKFVYSNYIPHNPPDTNTQPIVMTDFFFLNFRCGNAKTDHTLIAASVKDFERSRRRRRKAEDDASLKRRPGI